MNNLLIQEWIAWYFILVVMGDIAFKSFVANYDISFLIFTKNIENSTLYQKNSIKLLLSLLLKWRMIIAVNFAI